MTPDKIIRDTGAGLLACLGLIATLWPGVAQAQSGYACRALERHAPLPAVEGADGHFFAIRPELQNDHSLSDESVADIAALSAALAARGTTLVFLPVPTRAQVLDHLLPAMAGHVGYRADVSIAAHVDMIARLQAAGVTAVDARPALRAAALADGQPYFRTDPRPTPEGAQIMAQAVADRLADVPALSNVARASFVTRAGAEIALSSTMRAQLQRACQSELPGVTVTARTTTAASGTATGAQLVVLGSHITATPDLHLEGFLAAATGLQTQAYGLHDAGPYAALSSYLTSVDYAAAPPRVLVWEWPVVDAMGRNGPQPMAELIAAARGTCTSTLDLRQRGITARAQADLGALGPRGDVTLMFDTGGTGARQATFHITGADGLVRSRSIYRYPDQALTGRFYLPLNDLAGDGLSSVEVEIDTPFGARPTLMACFQ